MNNIFTKERKNEISYCKWSQSFEHLSLHQSSKINRWLLVNEILICKMRSIAYSLSLCGQFTTFFTTTCIMALLTTCKPIWERCFPFCYVVRCFLWILNDQSWVKISFFKMGKNFYTLQSHQYSQKIYILNWNMKYLIKTKGLKFNSILDEKDLV